VFGADSAMNFAATKRCAENNTSQDVGGYADAIETWHPLVDRRLFGSETTDRLWPGP
jgi:hypothetical protein